SLSLSQTSATNVVIAFCWETRLLRRSTSRRRFKIDKIFFYKGPTAVQQGVINSIPPQEPVRRAVIAIVGAGRCRIPDQVGLDAAERLAGRFEHLGTEFARVIGLSVVGLYGRVIG